ncbi:MAG: hypothetical protein ACRCTM_03120 [Sphaerotilus sulfidivorans]|uniref:hypothetical protein n=1 Tax=Sphaerotilus sulfidivorans TaxID=639200 RepID=UPI003F2C0065
MKFHRSSHRSLSERVLVPCAQLVLFCLAMPAILLAGGLVAVLAGLLSTVGLTHRQPRAPWHRAGVALRVLLRRTAS